MNKRQLTVYEEIPAEFYDEFVLKAATGLGYTKRIPVKIGDRSTDVEQKLTPAEWLKQYLRNKVEEGYHAADQAEARRTAQETQKKATNEKLKVLK